MTRKKTQEEFIRDVSESGQVPPHISFEKFIYVDARTKGVATCAYHGDFSINPNKLKVGRGCPECKLELLREKFSSSLEDWLPRFEEVHGRGTYDYSKFKYVNNRTKGVVLCKEHGEFLKSPSELYDKRQGCPLCSMDKNAWNRKSLEDRILEVRKIHQGQVELVSQEYLGISSRHEFTCKDHGGFTAALGNVIHNESGCSKCFGKISQPELDLAKFIESLGLFCESSFKLPSTKHIDLYVPSANLGIEYNGLYWHSEERGKDSNYHLSKLMECDRQGIRLVHIFEDEWLEKPDIVKEKLKSILGKSIRVGARRLTCRQVSWNTTRAFLETYHIQGSGSPGKVNLGLFDRESTLMAVMVIGSVRFSDEDNFLELLRYASIGTIQGGFSKLLSVVKREFSGHTLVTYADLRWSQANVYLKNGFELIQVSNPGYFWCKGQKRWNRMHMQKHKLKALFPEIYSDDKTEDQICKEAGFTKVYDCGQYRLELKL